MRHNYYYYQEQFDLVEKIENIAQNVEIETAKTGGYNSDPDGEHEGGYNPEIRECKVKWLQDDTLRSELMILFQQANLNSFGFDIEYIRDLQYTIYDGNQSSKGNYFKWHSDNNYTTDRFGDRKLTMIILLSDPHEYEGGRFDLSINNLTPQGEIEYWQPPEFKNKGDILIIPSFMYHRVNPVTAGLRKTFVAWAEGPKFR